MVQSEGRWEDAAIGQQEIRLNGDSLSRRTKGADLCHKGYCMQSFFRPSENEPRHTNAGDAKMELTTITRPFMLKFPHDELGRWEDAEDDVASYRMRQE